MLIYVCASPSGHSCNGLNYKAGPKVTPLISSVCIKSYLLTIIGMRQVVFQGLGMKNAVVTSKSVIAHTSPIVSFRLKSTIGEVWAIMFLRVTTTFFIPRPWFANNHWNLLFNESYTKAMPSSEVLTVSTPGDAESWNAQKSRSFHLVLHSDAAFLSLSLNASQIEW